VKPVPDLATAERQLLVAGWNRRARQPHVLGSRALRDIVAAMYEDEAAVKDATFDALRARGWLVHDPSADTWTLAGRALDLAPELHAEMMHGVFEDLLVRYANSPAFLRYCEKVHGSGVLQFNMMDTEQFDKVLDLVHLGPRSCAVDLGCGMGGMAEHIADTTGAHVTGIDFAASAIRMARDRTRARRDRLSFEVGDLNAIDLPGASFDAALMFDTLYFVLDLDSVIGDTLALLRPGGCLAVFYSTSREENEDPAILEPEETPVATALKRRGLNWESHDFTRNELEHWRRARQACRDLKDAFEAEGNGDLWRGRDEESKKVLAYCEAGRQRRYLYFSRLDNSL
jgi:SAM-dependent methyltransferase